MKVSWSAFCAALCLFSSTSVFADACVGIKAGNSLQLEGAAKQQDWKAPTGSVSLAVFKEKFAVENTLVVSNKDNAPRPQQSFKVGEKFVTDLLAAIEKDKTGRAGMRISYINKINVATAPNGGYPFYLVDTESEKAAKDLACSVLAKAPPLTDRGPATANECTDVATLSGFDKALYESTILFNAAGVMCWIPDRLRQGDLIKLQMVQMRGEFRAEAPPMNLTACTAPTAAPSFVSPPTPLPAEFQSGEQVTKSYELSKIGQPFECASSAPIVTMTIADETGKERSKAQTLNMYARSHAEFHLGAVQSKLRSPDFGLRTLNGQTTVVNKETDERGPEYLAMVVVQAIPRYFQTGMAYPGRDMLHDHEPRDRLGLVLAFGIKKPADRFGMGLSYEVARGINLVAVHEWLKRDRLDGVAVGDTFAGTAADIPVRKEWGKGWSFGITFDLAYVAQIFGGSKK